MHGQPSIKRKLRNEELHSFDSFCTVIQTRWMTQAGYTARLAKDKICA